VSLDARRLRCAPCGLDARLGREMSRHRLERALEKACRIGNASVAQIFASAVRSRIAEDPEGGGPLRFHLHRLLYETVEGRGHTWIVEMLLSAGANPNQRRTPNITTLLHDASARGLDDVMKALIDAGADVKARDFYGHGYADVYNAMGGSTII